MINIGNAILPLLCVCNGLLIPLAVGPDKRYPAGLKMSLEWEHVPQECVETDRAVIWSFHCDVLAEFTFQGKKKKVEELEHLDLWDGEMIIVKGRDAVIWVSACVQMNVFKEILRVKKNPKQCWLYVCSVGRSANAGLLYHAGW